jgi:hypothetical protein
MATFNKFNTFVADLANKVHNLGSDSLQIYLTNTAPVATNTVYNTPADLTTGGGYTAGGAVATLVSSTQAAGLYKLILNSPATWTGTGSGFGPFRYAVLYNNTAASKNLIGWYDYGSSISVPLSGTFNLTTDGTNGVIQLQ